MTAQAVVPIVRTASGVDVRLRGVSAVDERLAWASGQQGTVLRTMDGGVHWVVRPVPDAQGLDFRDIEAVDADTAVILAIGPGDASRIYRTSDGGASWTMVLRNADPRAFFDCMAFDGPRGWMLGDPVDGRFQLYATTDAGRRWTLTADGPEAAEGDAAFAASGTCIAHAHGTLAIATGGPQPSLRFRRDGERAWQHVAVPTFDGSVSAGLFSIAASERVDGFVAVGGDYRAESTAGPAVHVTMVPAPGHMKQRDVMRAEPFGRAAVPLPRTRGYRSGAACASTGDACIAVGPGGVERLRAGRWLAVSDEGFDAVSIAGGVAWMVGHGGRIARLTLDE